MILWHTSTLHSRTLYCFCPSNSVSCTVAHSRCFLNWIPNQVLPLLLDPSQLPMDDFLSETRCQAPGVPHTLQINCPHVLRVTTTSSNCVPAQTTRQVRSERQQLHSQIPFSTLIFNLRRPAVSYCMWHLVCFNNFELNCCHTNCIAATKSLF